MSTTITLKAATLERVLANGILFAAPAKDCLPALEVVRFAWDGDELLAVATNRYVLSVEHVDYEGDGNTTGRDEFSVSTADVKRAISLLKTVRLPRFPVAVKYDSDTQQVTFMVDGNTVTSSAYSEREFVKWRHLMPADDSVQAMEGITLSASYLGLLAKVKADRNSPVRFAFNGSKPCRVQIGEDFKAIIVPIRDSAARAAAA